MDRGTERGKVMRMSVKKMKKLMVGVVTLIVSTGLGGPVVEFAPVGGTPPRTAMVSKLVDGILWNDIAISCQRDSDGDKIEKIIQRFADDLYESPMGTYRLRKVTVFQSNRKGESR